MAGAALSTPMNDPMPTHSEVAARAVDPLKPKETAFAGAGVKWISPHVAALRLGVSKRTILGCIRAGKLPALKVNARVFSIAEIDLFEFAAQHNLHNSSQLSQLRPK